MTKYIEKIIQKSALALNDNNCFLFCGISLKDKDER